MSTELAFYDRFSNSESAVKMLGESIAMSKMFNCESIFQGNVLACECLARRIPPLMLAQRYHLIKNKLSMQADAMLAEFDAVGKHRVIERSPERAAIELEYEGKTYTFALTWEEAQCEPFVYEGKEGDVVDALAAGRTPKLKPKYATPRSRMQMLWARVVSDSVTAVYPGAKAGSYTPEEVDDFQGGPSALPATPDESDVIEGEVISTTTPSEAPPFDPGSDLGSKAEAATEPASGMCSASMSESIKKLFGELGLTPEQRTKAIRSRNEKAETVRHLSAAEADNLYQALRGKLAELTAGRIKLKLQAIEQEHPGTVAMITKKLKDSGFQKLADLPRELQLELLSAMDAPTALQSYVGAAIWQATEKN